MDKPQNRRQVTPLDFAAAALFLLMLGAAPVFAGEMPAPRLADMGGAALGLTPAQRQKLTALESDSRTKSHTLVTQIHQLRETLGTLYGAYHLNVADVRRTNLQMNRVQAQLLDLRLSEQLQMRQILSPGQFAQLQAAIRQHEALESDRHRDPDDRPERHDGDDH